MTIYHVTASKGARAGVWVLQCVEHPGAISETRRLSYAPDLMREAIAFVADMPQSEVEVEVQPDLDPGLLELLASAREHRQESERLAQRASEEFRKVAHCLVNEGVSLRDAGEILGVSYQRAHQLVSE